MKRLIFFLLAVFITFSTSAFAYTSQIKGKIPLTDNLTGISINPVTGIAAAISKETKTLYIIDSNTSTVINKILLDIVPSGVAVDTRRNVAIVSSMRGILHFMDIETSSLVRTISLDKAILSMAIQQDSDTLFIGGSEGFLLLDLETEDMINEKSLPNSVTGIETDSSIGTVLTVQEGKNTLSIYDIEQLQPLPEIGVGKIISAISVNPLTHIVVTVNSDNSVSLVSLEDRKLLETIPLNELLNDVAIDPVKNVALIAHNGGITILQLENPLPSIHTLIPESSIAGSSGFTLSIKGSQFIKDSRAKFNLKEMDTLFEDNANLKALVPSDVLLLPGFVPVSVQTPPPGGGESNTLTFSILNPVPQIESTEPDTVVLAQSSLTLRVRGKNFLANSVINFNGKNLKTRFISCILLEAQLDLTDIKEPSKYPVTVINPIPVSLTSNTVFLNIVKDISFLGSIRQADIEEINEPLNRPTGSLSGRMLNTDGEPVEGVTIRAKFRMTRTDANGYFSLDNLPEGRNFLLLDGSTAVDVEAHYPTIPIYTFITAGQVNDLHYQPYMHKQKSRNFQEINPSEETVLTDPEVPGFEMRIPKGVRIIGWDGQPNLRVSVRTVPPDRLSMKPLPPNAYVRTIYMFYFDKIGGGIPDQPIPFKVPNDLGYLPGEKAVIWYFDESPIDGDAPNEWAIAGTGTVTPDGVSIVSDPGFGIPKFCCGVIGLGGPGGPGGGPGGPPPPGCSGPGGSGDCPFSSPCGAAGDPVDLATGFFLHSKTDLSVPGIIPVNITRYYRSGDTGFDTFGKGTSLEYNWFLDTYQDMLLLIKPGNYQYRFAKQSEDAEKITYINSTDPNMRGSVATLIKATGIKTIRMRDGWSYKFPGRYLTEISDRNGNALTISRTQEGYLSMITTPEGRTVTFNLESVGHIRRTKSIVDSSGRSVIYTYETDPFSSYGRLKSVAYPDGSTIQYQYDSAGRLSGIVNGRGVVEVANEYYADDPNDPYKKYRVYKQTHPDGGLYTFNYTMAGGNITETSMTAPNGGTTTWRFYDDSGAYRDGYIPNKITPDGTYTYELEAGTNLLKSVTDPLGRKMTYTYYYTSDSTNGRIKTVTDNLGNVTSYEYETKYGLTTKITDALLKATTFTYTFDVNNRVTKIEIRDPLSKLTTINYNTNGLTTSIKDPNNNTTTFLYENSSKPTELTKIVDPLNNTTQMTYDILGMLESVTDAKDNTTFYTYDPMDRTSRVYDPLGGLTQYFYDPNGNLIIVADPKDGVIQYEYDNRNRISKMTDQLGRFETYTYYTGAEITPTTGDNLKSITDRKGQTTTFSQYDAMNRIKRIAYHDGSSTDYTYDTAGRVDYINDSISGYIDYTYNDFGCTTCTGRGFDRISREVTSLGTIDYTYDKVGRRLSMTVAGQPVVNYVYDAAGRMTSMDRKIGSKTRTYTLTYDNASRRTTQKIPVSLNNKYITTTYGYDTANKLLSMLQQGPSAQIENLLYEYDPNGNRTKFTRNTAQPSRDAVASAIYDDANEMLTFQPLPGSAKNMTHDNNGNLLTGTNSCGTTTYTWDARNRLTGISGYKNDCSSLTATFKYDAVGRRIEKTITGTNTKYLYDGMDIIQEIQGSNKTNYIRTLNIDEPLTRIKADGTVRHYVRDALGSITNLTDDTGVVKTTYTYDPFGNVTVSGEASDNPFQYTGRENDGTGLYYYRARYYSPELQRFISEDPIGLKGGINFYVYADNNPLNYTDPEGKAPRPGIPGYWGILRKIAPRTFCSMLNQRCKYAEEQNKDCRAIDGEDCWKIDPDAYKWLSWCKKLGYIK